jgi:hypothetical protein
MPERSKHQQNIIRKYYQNRDHIALQRVQELISELYLSVGKQRQRHWKNLSTHLAKLNVAQGTIDHLVQQDDPQLAAKLVERLGKDP